MPQQIYNCIICDKRVIGYTPVYCCSGRECTCYGYPITPCVCSKDECIKEVFGEYDPVNPKEITNVTRKMTGSIIVDNTKESKI